MQTQFHRHLAAKLPLLSLNNCLRSTFRSLSAGDTILSFKNVSFEYSPLKPILNDATFTIKEGSKVTIMGQNGSGKSTILKLMNNILRPTEGSVNIRTGLALSTALQVIPPDDRDKTVYEFFLSKAHGAKGGLDSRIASALQRVNLLEAHHDRLIRSFSGGQQARLLLASALILEPDILLLDEPTNNLDTVGIEMLRELILTSTKTCVVISHDEDFLNSFTDSVLYLDQHFKKVEYYDGGYDTVKRDIAARIERENAENARLMRLTIAKKEQASVFANKGGSNIRKAAKKLKEDAKVLEERKITVRKEDKALKSFEFPLQPSPGLKLLTVKRLILPQGRELSLSPNELIMTRGMKVRIKGSNGVGKTTCLENMLSEEVDPSAVNIPDGVKIGYYRQDFQNLDYEQLVIDGLRDASDGEHDEQVVRAIAAQFLLTKELMKQPIGTLSEGQKGLLMMACLVLKEPAILIMDEPTNHINFRHLPAIAAAIDSFKGAVILVSHDEEFVSQIKIGRVLDLDQKS